MKDLTLSNESWNFQRAGSGGDPNQKKLLLSLGKGMDIFWNNTIELTG